MKRLACLWLLSYLQSCTSLARTRSKKPPSILEGGEDQMSFISWAIIRRT